MTKYRNYEKRSLKCLQYENDCIRWACDSVRETMGMHNWADERNWEDKASRLFKFLKPLGYAYEHEIDVNVNHWMLRNTHAEVSEAFSKAGIHGGRSLRDVSVDFARSLFQ